MATSDYDIVDYPYTVRGFTHPARMGVVAQLYGHDFAPFSNCRMLEIGGGDGVNLLSMALAAPNSTFVNFDLSEKAIALGGELVALTGARNLRMEARDVLDAGDTLGEFDYIIAHGVYAWVPAPVREALMALLGGLLSPRGVAMISYNAFPGCRIRSAVRDLAVLAARGHERPSEKIASVRDLMRFHIERWDRNDPGQNALRDEAARLLEKPDGVIFHDELCENWNPQYVMDVAMAARAQGLDYLGDMQTNLIGDALFPTSLFNESTHRTNGDFAAYEQISDFARGRSFRQTLLCRGGEKLDRRFNAARLDGLWVDGIFERDEAAKVEIGEIAFKTPSGGGVKTTNRDLIAIFERLTAAWPAALPMSELTRDVALREALARLFVGGAIGLMTEPFPVCARPGEKPVASALARAQIAVGASELVTLRHSQARVVDDNSRAFLRLLDGTRARAEVAAQMPALSGADADAASAAVNMALAKFTRSGLMAG